MYAPDGEIFNWQAVSEAISPVPRIGGATLKGCVFECMPRQLLNLKAIALGQGAILVVPNWRSSPCAHEAAAKVQLILRNKRQD